MIAMLTSQAPACHNWNLQPETVPQETSRALLRHERSFDFDSEVEGFPNLFEACGVWDSFRSAVRCAPLPVKDSGGRCDKCDELHPTDQCPHFKKDRDKHEDAWRSKLGTPGRRCANAPRRLYRHVAQVTRMPGDGSCLFHSLAFGLRGLGWNEDGRAIRRKVANFISRNPDIKIGSNTLRTWVDWDSRLSVGAYASRLSAGGQWGGAIEMAVVAQIFQVDVVVYEKDYFGNMDLISDFLAEKQPRGVVKVLYSGRMHYDALQDGTHTMVGAAIPQEDHRSSHELDSDDEGNTCPFM